MTRKDFELIAQTLRYADEIVDQDTLEALADIFANALSITNPAFNRQLFIAKATATDTKRAQLGELIGAN